MQENQTQTVPSPADDLEIDEEAFRQRLLAQIDRFIGRRSRTKAPYAGAQHRGDGFDDLRLARAQAKRERRAVRNLSNGLPR